MTIHVNKLTAPTITITGKLIGAQSGHTSGVNSSTAINDAVTISGTSVTGTNGFSNNKSRVPTFYVAAGDSITVTLAAPGSYTNKDNTAVSMVKQTYNDGSGDLEFVGKANNSVSSGGVVVNMKSETFYTLNGKDPSRTKTNLYTGPFTVTVNKSGTDNTVIKARTYWQGKVSEVSIAQIKVYRPDTTKV